MASERAGSSHQNDYFYDSSEGEISTPWDSDNSIKDKDYTDSDSSESSSISTSEEVRI